MPRVRALRISGDVLAKVALTIRRGPRTVADPSQLEQPPPIRVTELPMSLTDTNTAGAFEGKSRRMVLLNTPRM
jgi:hypothetical protein